jgi:putative ABC transport system substrate-binding protein
MRKLWTRGEAAVGTRVLAGLPALVLAVGALAVLLGGGAQPAAGVPRVGALRPQAPDDPADRASMSAFLGGLREAGYAPARDVHVELRYARGKLERLPALARELVALPVAAIVTSNPYATSAALEATATVPIVVALDGLRAGSA